MINVVPENWEYNKDLELLFLFYQSTDELLSEVTPDTYALPLHNALSLIGEIIETYSLIKEHNSIDKYYSKYIPCIVDELLQKIEDDYILKRIFGKRLDSIVTGFKEAKTEVKKLQYWLDIFKQSCNISKYRELYKSEIINLIISNKDKQKLLYCIQNYYVTLIYSGYSREHLYICAKKFFNSTKINNSNQIKDFLKQFNCSLRNYDFLVLMDIENFEYLDNISDIISFNQNIQKVDVDKERKKLCEDVTVMELFKEYDNMKTHSREHQKIEIVRVTTRELDPYKSVVVFSEYIAFLQTFKRYFIHHKYSKQVFAFLLKKDDGKYTRISPPNKVKKRPYINQQLIDLRIKNILTAHSMGKQAFFSLAQALGMHAEAFDSKNTSTLFRSLWTALETLFSNPSHDAMRENVINSVLSIIQKTYILKIMRAMHSQLIVAIDKKTLEDIGIQEFCMFIKYFASYTEDSAEMKKIYSCLSVNPLLRSRVHGMRKKLKNGVAISKFLENHRLQIEWQLHRLYRIRNIFTHLGTEINGADMAINHLHNYFDYVVNYMLCKSENGDFVPNVSAMVFEAKNDVQIHNELLKSDEPLSNQNYMDYLFGPDINLINYKFEH